MIHIKKGQQVPENSNLLVFSATGDYNDDDLVECCDAGNLTMAVNAFQAQFIKYGSMVYRYNEQEQLGEAIVEIDPGSTHDSAYLFMEEKGRRDKRKLGKLRPENPAKMKMDPTKKTVEEVPVETEPAVTETEPVTEPIVDTTATSTSPIDTTATTTQQSTSTSSTSNASSTPTGTSTSTPDFNFDTSTTTPSFGASTSTPIGDTSTTTPTNVSTSTPSFNLDTSTTTPSSTAINEVASSTSDGTASVLDAINNIVSTTTSSVEPTIQEATSTVSDIVALAKKVARKRIK